MKIKNKGKVHPSPSSSSSSASSSVAADRDRDVRSVLKLLPTAILALVSVLSLEDREVLAYMITWSLKTTTNPSSLVQCSKKKSSKRSGNDNQHNNNSNHNAPVFDCDCFDCYTSYWFRWDSSPNRELIHQAIEAFEEHLTTGEQSKENTRGKKRDKTSRRTSEKWVLDVPAQPEIPVVETPLRADESSSVVPVVHSDDDASPAVSRGMAADRVNEDAAKVNETLAEPVPHDAAETHDMAVVIRTHAAVSSHRGLARKVLPDVLGLLNSRLWSLWGPNA